jgi:hypothetical protein
MKDNAGGLRRTIALLLASAAVTGLATACSMDTRDAMCMPDEYPVAYVGHAGGGACVAKDEEPPKGSLRFPAGQVPQHVDDKWDTYWQKHAMDANGKLMTDPNKVRY